MFGELVAGLLGVGIRRECMCGEYDVGLLGVGVRFPRGDVKGVDWPAPLIEDKLLTLCILGTFSFNVPLLGRINLGRDCDMIWHLV
jgi:hypothetical protein